MKKQLIKEINPEVLDKLRGELQPAMDKVGDTIGLKLVMGRITYARKDAHFRVEVLTLDETGSGITKEAIAFSEQAHLYGLKPEWLNQTFVYKGETYKIVGLSTRTTRYPVKTVLGDKPVSFVADAVLEAFDPKAFAQKLDEDSAEAKQRWKAYAENLSSMGIDGDWLGRTAVLDGQTITVQGLSTSGQWGDKTEAITVRVAPTDGKARLQDVSVDTISRLMTKKKAA